MLLQTEDGKSMLAIDVFSAAISYLKGHFLESINSRNPGNCLEIDRVCWVLTVPAIWSDAAKQFMREAAEKAGIPKKNLMIALEPECASIFCKTKKVEDFQMSVRNNPGTKYVVLDNGGGTVDATVHQINDDGALQSLHMPTGGSWGGSRVNEQFEKYFEKLLTKAVLKTVKKDNPDQWLKLMRDFEDIKTSLDETVQEFYTMYLTSSILNVYKDIRKRKLTEDNTFQFRSEGAYIQGEETLKIPRGVIVGMIKKVSQKIRDHTSNLLRECDVEDIDFINLVGGFSNSKIVRSDIESLNIADVHAPEDAELAVLKGAVIAGWNPNVIASRRSMKTYGIHVRHPFQKYVHPEQLKVILDGTELCYKVFDPFVSINQDVKVGEKVSKIYHPLKNDISTVIEIYASSKREVKYCNESGCEKLGFLTLPMPILTGGVNRNIKIDVFFGNTEFRVDALDETSGGSVNASYDFLNSH